MSEILTAEATLQKNPKLNQVADAYAPAADSKHLAWDLVEQYLPLLKSIVSKMRLYFPQNIDIEDIYSIGLTGLISAVKNKDSSKVKSFGAYAKIRIRGALLDELRRVDTLSREDRSSSKKYNKAVDSLSQKLNRVPLDNEICLELRISRKEYEKIKNIKNPVHIPLDTPCAINHPNGTLMHEVISDPTEQDGRDVTQNHELVELLRNCIAALDDIPRKVLGMYYLENMRLAEIATIFNLTESRICQIHSTSLAKLRAMLKEKMAQ